MEKFKGTKGEWFLSETQNLRPTHVAIKTNQNSRLICLISEPKNMDVEDNANAKLITNAPKLLEAMVEFCERVDKGEVRSTKTYNKIKNLILIVTEVS